MSSTYTVTRDTSYVYEHTRPDTGAIFYVGKGVGKRAFSRHQRNRHWHFIVSKAGGYTVNFLKEHLDEESALLCEVERISQLRSLGIILCNYTSGGEGTSGYKHTKESLDKISAASKMSMLGRKKAPESISKMASTKRGKKHSDEHNFNISLGNMGRVISQETIKKRRLKTVGRKNSQEACKNISDGKRRANELKRNGGVV